MSELGRWWYHVLSQLSLSVSAPFYALADRVELPLLSALLFGLIGALSPCQLTTNASAMAYVSRRLGEARIAWKETVAFTLGKVLVYTIVGGLVILAGIELEAASIPVVKAARKAVGPLLIVIGLSFLGLFRLKGSVGEGFRAWLKARIPQQGVLGAFLMGIAFSFAFCPTLFWLFFGLTIPLGLGTSGGLIYPGIFALGTTLPLLAFTALFSFSSQWAEASLKRSTAVHRLLSRIVGIIFVVMGMNDTFTYWAL
ncbi:MAG: sulfite exporter TauE/SafE family protein [candidate division NC10 bacterium]|nr:sulfite exporter TauE/SafE family protein [candidate division NC10 bacterium]